MKPYPQKKPQNGIVETMDEKAVAELVFNIYKNLKNPGVTGITENAVSKWVMAERSKLFEEDD